MNKIINSFKKQFNCTLKYESISFELGKAHAFFIEIEDSISISYWKEMRNFIAIEFQNTLFNEFERWNIYLFYNVSSTISNELKYQIENDTFSSRKIVIEGKSDYTEIINVHILNSDITIDEAIENDEAVENIVVFTPNREIYDELAIVEVKSRVTNPLKEAHSRILRKLKEGSHEI